jgi:CoA-transferase family III
MDRSRLRTGGVIVVGYLSPPAGSRSLNFVATNVARMQHNDALQEHVASWATERPRADMLADLDAHGVVAVPVKNVRDTVKHPHFREGPLVELAGFVLGSGLGRVLDWTDPRAALAATAPTGAA